MANQMVTRPITVGYPSVSLASCVIRYAKSDVERLTRDTLVGGLHVGDQISATRLPCKQLGIRYGDCTGVPARAAPVDVIGDVSRAANGVLSCQASAAPHSPVAR